MLTRNAETLSNLPINILQYLIKNSLSHIILVIHLKINLSEKFNLNLRFILKRTSDPDNQDNALYKVSFTKLIDILQNNNFKITESRDKLWGLVPKRSPSGW